MSATVETTPTATFTSVRRNARFVYIAQFDKFDAFGRSHRSPGITVEFKDGRLDVGPEMQPMLDKFNREMDASVTVADIVEWLRGHERFNDQLDGFFEIDLPAPDPQPEIGAIARAAASLQVDTVRGILDAELAGHNRPAVIATAEAALEQMTVEVDAAKAAQAEAAPKAKPGPKPKAQE